MDHTVISYKCPNCSGGLEYKPGSDKLVCPFCDSEFKEQELKDTKAYRQAREEQRLQEEFNAQMVEYNCPSCGAEILADENTAADMCPYCHNPVALKGRLSGALRPDKVVPFKYDAQAAKQKFIETMGKRKFVPGNFLATAQLEKIQGIYYPFWVADADTDSSFTGIGTKVRTWRAGNIRYTETSKYDVFRRGDIHFEDLSTAALSEADKAILEGILPFPATCHEDFSMTYLSGFVTKKRDMDRKDVEGDVKNRIDTYSEQLLRETIHGYSSVSTRERRAVIKQSRWEYCLMPIWLLTYNTPKRRYVFAMNGYTGKTYGELPIDWKKLLLVGLGIGLGIGLLAALLVPAVMGSSGYYFSSGGGFLIW